MTSASQYTFSISSSTRTKDSEVSLLSWTHSGSQQAVPQLWSSPIIKIPGRGDSPQVGRSLTVRFRHLKMSITDSDSMTWSESRWHVGLGRVGVIIDTGACHTATRFLQVFTMAHRLHYTVILMIWSAWRYLDPWRNFFFRRMYLLQTRFWKEEIFYTRSTHTASCSLAPALRDRKSRIDSTPDPGSALHTWVLVENVRIPGLLIEILESSTHPQPYCDHQSISWWDHLLAVRCSSRHLGYLGLKNSTQAGVREFRVCHRN